MTDAPFLKAGYVPGTPPMAASNGCLKYAIYGSSYKL